MSEGICEVGIVGHLPRARASLEEWALPVSPARNTQLCKDRRAELMMCGLREWKTLGGLGLLSLAASKHALASLEGQDTEMCLEGSQVPFSN